MQTRTVRTVFFKPGFTGLTGTRVLSVWRAASSHCRPTVGGHLLEVDSRGRGPWTVR